MGVTLGFVVVALLVGGFPSALAQPASRGTTPPASLQVSVGVSPQTVTAGNPVTFSAQVSGQVGTLSYVWFNTPSGCNPQPVQSWSCSIASPGKYSINVTVTNSTGVQGTAGASFTVTNNGGNGNGNGNGGGSNGNNSNGLNLSGFGPILFYGLIAGIVGFALLVILTVAVVVIAVTLRRLPRPPKGGIACGSCHAVAPAGSKFCPACAAALGPAKG